LFASGGRLASLVGLGRTVRQVYAENAAGAGRGFDSDRAAIALHQAIAHRQAETCAALWMGREERVEQPREITRGNAAAVVAHADDGAAIRRIGGRNVDSALHSARVGRFGDQSDQYLRWSEWIGGDRRPRVRLSPE